MKRYIILHLLFLILFISCNTGGQKGNVILLENFPSQYVKNRNIEVYTPPGYSKNKFYPVLYMHDGQNVFNPATSYSGIDWGVDEAIDSLVELGIIEPLIVVAVWNSPLRSEEYCPAVISGRELSDFYKKDYPNVPDSLHIISDDYLKFMVREVKPFIDSAFKTKANQKNTYIMGSSMGGLISAYAVSEYPEVFGGAACLSTHWPAVSIRLSEWIKKDFPKAGVHKWYFDRGTEQIDSEYGHYQEKVNKIFDEKGYSENIDYISLEFKGAGHSELAWKQRIHIPLEFLVGKR